MGITQPDIPFPGSCIPYTGTMASFLPAGCSVRGPLDSTTWARVSANVRELRLCSQQLSRSDQRGVGESWRGPAGTSLCAVTRHHKLFCKSV